MAGRIRRLVGACLFGTLVAGCAVPGSLPSMERWAVGDSLTWGSVYGTIVGPGWPVYYTEQTGRPISNLAVSALTIGEVWNRTKLVISEQGRPQRIAILAGTNDLTNRTVAQMAASTQAFADDMANRGIDIVWITLPPFPEGSFLAVHDAKRVEYNQWLLANLGDRALDCSTVLTVGQWMNPDYALGDQSHLNATGSGVLASCIVPHLP